MCIRASSAIRKTNTIDLGFRDRAGSARLYRKDQYRRQHPHPGQGDPPRIPPAGRRRLQPRADRPFAHPHPQPGLLQGCRRQECARQPARPHQSDGRVTEQSTGSLQVGLGYSSTSLAGRRSQLYRDQLVRPRPDPARLRCRSPRSASSSQFSFTEPYFLDRPLAAGFDLHQAQTNYDQATFQSDTTAAVLRLGFPISEYSSVSLSYTYKIEEVRPLPARRWKCSWRPVDLTARSSASPMPIPTWTMCANRPTARPSRFARLRRLRRQSEIHQHQRQLRHLYAAVRRRLIGILRGQCGLYHRL